MLGKIEDLLRKRFFDVLSKSAAIEPAEHDEPRLTFYESRDSGLGSFTDNQIAFPVTRHSTIIGFRRTFAQKHHVLQLSRTHCPARRTPLSSAGSQTLSQLLA